MTRDEFEVNGFVHLAKVIDDESIARWRDALTSDLGGRAGQRDLWRGCPNLIPLFLDSRLLAIASSLLGSKAFAVRSLLFDKTAETNWKIHWHQDTVIAVKQAIELPRFVGWSVKDGIHHVQPPAEILGRMVALRIHLDDALEENGPLRVIAGSHRQGWVEEKDLASWRERGPCLTLPAHAGDVIAMSPLLLHASAPSQSPSHRRVVHVECACENLPGGLEWFERIGAGEARGKD